MILYKLLITSLIVTFVSGCVMSVDAPQRSRFYASGLYPPTRTFLVSVVVFLLGFVVSVGLTIAAVWS